jgi:hypothetical protein
VSTGTKHWQCPECNAPDAAAELDSVAEDVKVAIEIENKSLKSSAVSDLADLTGQHVRILFDMKRRRGRKVKAEWFDGVVRKATAKLTQPPFGRYFVFYPSDNSTREYDFLKAGLDKTWKIVDPSTASGGAGGATE